MYAQKVLWLANRFILLGFKSKCKPEGDTLSVDWSPGKPECFTSMFELSKSHHNYREQ